MQDKIPTGKLARGRVAGMAAAKIGAKRLGLLTKRPFLGAESYRRAQEEHEQDAAETLFRALTQLRGTALKMAQIMSLEIGVLPEAYVKELEKSHYRVPPLNRAVVRKILHAEFGKFPEEFFKTFEDEAFAAASLGQVHRAVSKNGDPLAVKVQYPGIDRALKSDLELVKSYLAPFFRSDYLAGATREIEQRLLEEIDYKKELETTQWFYDNLSLKGIVVPQPFPDYSTKHVLSTSLIEGRHLDEWLATNPSQQEKNSAAQALYDLFAHSVFRLGRMHCDPNPGNYLFRSNGTIGLIDFGAVRAYEAERTEALARLWRAHITQDIKTEKELYVFFGVKPELYDERYLSHYRIFGDWLALPFKEKTFSFKKNLDYAAVGFKAAQKAVIGKSVEGFTSELIMLDRNLYGLYRIFQRLEAEVNFHNEWLY